MFHNLKILAEKHFVTLMSFIEQEQELENIHEIEALGVKVKTVLRRPVPAQDLLLSKPREHWEYASTDLKTLVRDALAKNHYDVVQVEFIQMGQHVPRGVPLFRILTEHEVHFANSWNAVRTEPHCAAKIGKFYEWLTQFNYEIRMCRQFDRIVCMTEQDRSLLSSFVPPAKPEMDSDWSG